MVNVDLAAHDGSTFRLHDELERGPAGAARPPRCVVTRLQRSAGQPGAAIRASSDKAGIGDRSSSALTSPPVNADHGSEARARRFRCYPIRRGSSSSCNRSGSGEKTRARGAQSPRFWSAAGGGRGCPRCCPSTTRIASKLQLLPRSCPAMGWYESPERREGRVNSEADSHRRGRLHRQVASPSPQASMFAKAPGEVRLTLCFRIHAPLDVRGRARPPEWRSHVPSSTTRWQRG